MDQGASEFIRRIERNQGQGERAHLPRGGLALASFMALPELRAFWPFNSVNENGQYIYDLSGQGRNLSNTGVTRSWTGAGVAYGIFNGSSAYLARASEAGLNITGAQTWCGWFYATSLGTNNHLMGRSDGSTWTNTGLKLEVYNGNTLLNASTGASVAQVVGGAFSTSQWHFVAGRFTPSSELAVFIDGVKNVNTTSIPASVNNPSVTTTIGATYTPNQYLTGRAALCCVCAAALPDASLTSLYQTSAQCFG